MALDRAWGGSPTSILTAHLVGAALAAAAVLERERGIDRERLVAAYARTATNGVYSARDLLFGQTILERAGLVHVDGDGLVLASEFDGLRSLSEAALHETLARQYLMGAAPVWLTAAVGPDGVTWDLVPDVEKHALTNLISDPVAREAFLLACGRRADPDADKRTGDLAEDCVVDACRAQLIAAGHADLAHAVRRVSLISDQLGYDITAPRCDGSQRRLEIKGTRARGDAFAITLSRGEATVASRDPDWILVACHVAADDSVSVAGWCTGAALMPFLPQDAPERGRWRSVEIAVDTDLLAEGLPPC